MICPVEWSTGGRDGVEGSGSSKDSRDGWPGPLCHFARSGNVWDTRGREGFAPHENAQ